jgi:hypothetical protein
MVNESSQLTFIEEFAYMFWLACKLSSGQLKMYIWTKYCLQILVSREVWRFYPLKSAHSYMALGFVSPLLSFVCIVYVCHVIISLCMDDLDVCFLNVASCVE